MENDLRNPKPEESQDGRMYVCACVCMSDLIEAQSIQQVAVSDFRRVPSCQHHGIQFMLLFTHDYAETTLIIFWFLVLRTELRSHAC